MKSVPQIHLTVRAPPDLAEYVRGIGGGSLSAGFRTIAEYHRDHARPRTTEAKQARANASLEAACDLLQGAWPHRRNLPDAHNRAWARLRLEPQYGRAWADAHAAQIVEQLRARDHNQGQTA